MQTPHPKPLMSRWQWQSPSLPQRARLSSRTALRAELLSVALVALLASSCVHAPKVIIFTCPDVSPEVIDDLGPAALDWYINSFDPWCERLEAGAQAGR